MAQETVGNVVAALAESFAAGLECYTDWRQRQRQRNNYQTRKTADVAGSGMCAVHASLATSKLRIEEAFNNGADVLGDEFVSGDATCRNVLLEDLWRLQECIEVLEIAVGIEYHPLPLSELISVSEAVRVSSLAALHKQYQRIVVGRLAPRVSSSSSSSTLSPPVDEPVDDSDVKRISFETEAEVARTRGDAHLTSPDTSSGSNSNDNCELPSPPPTPARIFKEQPDQDDDLLSTYSQSAVSSDSQPRNSVFSTFCPEAVKYQVDVEKPLPAEGTRCRCGYDWNATYCAKDRSIMVVKDGFQITSRFLGKSHCEDGLGCVLCTSSGETKTFGNVEDLKAHINSSHTKWQLLHDRDLTGR
ncbi:hypothetical protein F4860DRAFT_503400 [Xylaria cubensis]|nr:hypothetical protein F4860DRAFT_503400 [Xylaria cubensis]